VLTLAVWCVASAFPQAADAQTVGYTSSIFVARTTYETERVTSVYFFNGVDVSSGPVRLSASIPLIRQQTTALGTLTDPAQLSASRTSSGFGDPLIRLDVRVLDDRRRGLQVGVAGSVKPPLVDAEDGLGTGVADYAAGVSALKSVGGTIVLGDALYWKYGDPEGVDFENSLSYSVGVGRAMGGGRWSSLVSFAGFSPVADAPAPLLITVGVMTLTGRSQSLAITAGFGLTSTASDFSIGTSWRFQN
jgi:hypothetical protein